MAAVPERMGHLILICIDLTAHVLPGFALVFAVNGIVFDFS